MPRLARRADPRAPRKKEERPIQLVNRTLPRTGHASQPWLGLRLNDLPVARQNSAPGDRRSGSLTAVLLPVNSAFGWGVGRSAPDGVASTRLSRPIDFPLD